MPVIALYFTTETERQDIVGAASAANEAHLYRGHGPLLHTNRGWWCLRKEDGIYGALLKEMA